MPAWRYDRRGDEFQFPILNRMKTVRKYCHEKLLATFAMFGHGESRELFPDENLEHCEIPMKCFISRWEQVTRQAQSTEQNSRSIVRNRWIYDICKLVAYVKRTVKTSIRQQHDNLLDLGDLTIPINRCRRTTVVVKLHLDVVTACVLPRLNEIYPMTDVKPKIHSCLER